MTDFAKQLWEIDGSPGLSWGDGTCDEERYRKLAIVAQQARDEALEEAARVAAEACFIPPDGGSPTDEERIVSETAASRIHSLKSTASVGEIDPGLPKNCKYIFNGCAHPQFCRKLGRCEASIVKSVPAINDGA